MSHVSMMLAVGDNTHCAFLAKLPFPEVFLTYWRRRLAIASARGVASLVLGGMSHVAPCLAHHCMPASPKISLTR